MKYYIVIGHKKSERVDEGNAEFYDCDWVELIERDDPYSEHDFPPGAHQLFGFLDINFNENVQYGWRATKTQEAWLIGRHRIARMLDFGNFGYQFVRDSDTKHIQFPDKITLSLDKKIKDNGVNKPDTDNQQVDIEFTHLNEQIIHCYDKECDIDPIVFKLAQFDNYGDAYIDLKKNTNYQDFKSNIDNFIYFWRNYPNSNVYLNCKPEQELEIKNLLKNVITNNQLTNYFEFCDDNFERRSPRYRGKSGTPGSEYDTFSETIDEFFNEHSFNANLLSEKNFYNVPFKKAKITIKNNWFVYASSEKFIKFLQYNPELTLEVSGAMPDQIIQFIKDNSIKANIVLIDEPNNSKIKELIAYNRQEDIQAIIHQHGYDNPESTPEEELNDVFRLTLEKYAPQKLNLSTVENQNIDIQVGQNQNQNQNQSQQLRQSNNAPYEPIKLEINSKSSIPDVNFESQEHLLERVIGLKFQDRKNAPQTEANVNYLLIALQDIINCSSVNNEFCPLSYSVDELIPGVFYVPKEKLKSISHPNSLFYLFDDKKNTYFFSPTYASIAIKKDKYAFKLFPRSIDNNNLYSTHELLFTIHQDNFLNDLIAQYKSSEQKQKITLLLNKLYAKRGQAGVDLLTKSLYAVKLKNPTIYDSLIESYLLTSNDFSEYVDNTRTVSVFEALAKLKDKKKIDWWIKLLKIQCKTNPNFELSHLFSQFTGFWEDLDKLQKFIPIPEQFPFDNFADAGITLGKMYRIMSKSRNRFEQIKSFEGGNISHAYMLFDLFNSTMYCKEMDDYCVSLTKQIYAEDAFDKSKLKETYFSTKKLTELSDNPEISLEQFKSYLLVFAAVNGNTQKHNNSDLAFYKALFNRLEEKLQTEEYSEAEKKRIYSTIMLFASYGNNTTKERMAQDINLLFEHDDLLEYCKVICTIYKTETVSKFFSAQEESGKMTNSEAMISFHSFSVFSKEHPFGSQIINKITDLIVRNNFLSPALQKVMRDTPKCFNHFTYSSNYLINPNDEKQQLIQSLFILIQALGSGVLVLDIGFYSFTRDFEFFDKTILNYLNQLFLDIDFTKFPKSTSLFWGNRLSPDFLAKAARAQNLDDLIFVFQDYDVRFATIKATEEGLLGRIKQLENNLLFEENKKHYITSYQDLILKRLSKVLGTSSDTELFYQHFMSKIDSSLSPSLLKTSYDALLQIIDTQKKDDLLKIIAVLQRVQIGTNPQSIASASLLKVMVSLLKTNYSIDGMVDFLETINECSSQNANDKLSYLQLIFEKIEQDPNCYEQNDNKKKINKRTKNQIDPCIRLVKTIDNISPSLFKMLSIVQNKITYSNLSTSEYLQFLEVLASPSNSSNPVLKNEFTLINSSLLDRVEQFPDGFSDLLDIARFDAELLISLSFKNRKELSLVAKICKNELWLNARKKEQPTANYKELFAQNIKILLSKQQLNVAAFYSETQLASPSAEVLVKLLNHYKDNFNKAFHHFEKDTGFNRPHKKNDLYGNHQVEDKDLAYQMGQFDMSKQNEVLDQITRNDFGFEKSVKRNVLFIFANYINELGYRLPAFQHTNAEKQINVPVRKLSDKELKFEFERIKKDIASLRSQGQTNIWQNKKYQRTVCALLAIIREAVYREGTINAYSTQMDAILLALLAGDYQYAMQINTGEGKSIIAAAIAIALQTITDKQIVITTSNLDLASRDSEASSKLMSWFGISHEAISATTKDKSKLQAKLIHTTGNDFALCHGKDLIINNNNRIYLNDEYDYTSSHLTPSINSQSKPNEEKNWWIYEEILAYVVTMDKQEARKKPEQQARDLIGTLSGKFNQYIDEIEKERAYKLHLIEQNEEGKSSEEQILAKEIIEKDCQTRIDFYAKRIAKLNQAETEDQFNTLIDSAIIAQFVLKKGEGYEVIDQIEEGKILKKVVPTEGGKPITEGDVLYMYGIHQFLIQKTIMEYKEAGDPCEFIKPSALESTTYFNNYSTQAGSKTIGITGTIPKEIYKMYEAHISGGKTDIIPPHQESQRIDAVPYEQFTEISANSEHVCQTEEQLIKKLTQAIQDHDGPSLIYCNNKNVCEARRDALIKQLEGLGYTVQMVIPGITENFTSGDKLTATGRTAQNKKTVTLTVGDGRGIDLVPQGTDGLLTLCSFVPETTENLLQIYGRSGRNGKPGKTNLFILENELNKYGIQFKNLDEEFKFLDELRYKEFNFLIKKIGFMQYEVQKLIRDEQNRITIIAYMDDLYNKLLLKAVADKVKNSRNNWIGDYKISGRWEPFAMLNDKELENIYQEFRNTLTDKLSDMQLYHINCEHIANLQEQYREQINKSIQKEKREQKGQEKEEIYRKIKRHTGKQESKFGFNSYRYNQNNKVELVDGTSIDLSDDGTRIIYKEFALNLSRYDKTISLMQKYIGNHLGIYGFIHNKIALPYERIYQLLDQQNQIINQYKQQQTACFYEYLIYQESLSAIKLLLEDSRWDSKKSQIAIEQHFKNAERYANMIKPEVTLANNTIAYIRDKALNYYKTGSLTDWDRSIFNELQFKLSETIQQVSQVIENQEEKIITQCQEVYLTLQDKLYDGGSHSLNELASRPMNTNSSKLADLFALLQMVTKEEKNFESIQRVLNEVAEEVKPKVNEYNVLVKEYNELIKKQRACFEVLKRPHDSQDKFNKYEEIISFTHIASKNMVKFYYDYNKLPEILPFLKEDISKEQIHLEQLEKEKKIILDQELAQEIRNKRKEYRETVQNKITTVLTELRDKINKIEHPLSTATKVANHLFDELKQAQTDYLRNLEYELNQLNITVVDFVNDPNIQKVNKNYIQACDDLINDPHTRNVLERDLNWGTYLNNLLKTIANMVILTFTTALTFNSYPVNNFFSLNKSKTIEIIEEEQENLKPKI